jgi:DNA polymerase I-like protein with 3'-5' exonuclease and polymerase domains
LFYLNSDQSPIKLLVKDLEKKFLESDAAKKANKIISKASSVPTSSLFGDQQTLVKLNKKEHLQLIFFKVLGLKPLSKGKAGKGKKEGAGKLDKEFQGEYSSVPEVAMYTETQKAKKIRDAFVKSFIKKLKENPDVQKDKHIRSRYSYLKVVTHRTSSEDPNLQQIPSRGKLAKYIKRLFVAPEGHLYIKVDYQVHEIRGWGIISKDTEVAKAFEHGKKLRDQYKLNPASELAARIELEGDVHKINAAYFFKLKIEAIDKTIRDSVKAVVFGLIYGKGVKALSKDIKGTEKEAQELLDKFFKRFPKAVGWTNNIKKFAKEHLFTEALTGIRRNLWGFLIPESHPDQGKIHAQMSRQAGNSPIQGMCSKFMMNGIRLINKYTFQLMKQRGDFVLKTCNSVHDSLEALSKYENFMKSLSLIEWCLTEGVAQVVEERHGERLVSVPQIDMDIGSCLANVSKWDWSMPELYKLVKESLEFQRDELKYNVDVAKTLKMIFSQTEDYPKWLKQQVKNTGWKLPKYTDSRLEKETVES